MAIVKTTRWIRMADVGSKKSTARCAVARCEVVMTSRTLSALKGGGLPKGDVLCALQLSGIMAAKKTSQLIPLCHPLNIERVSLHHKIKGECLVIEAEVKTHAQTGPEMEALVACAMAALTVYDMCKSIERGIEIRHLYLVSKSGGKSGIWRRKEQ